MFRWERKMYMKKLCTHSAAFYSCFSHHIHTTVSVLPKQTRPSDSVAKHSNKVSSNICNTLYSFYVDELSGFLRHNYSAF